LREVQQERTIWSLLHEDVTRTARVEFHDAAEEHLTERIGPGGCEDEAVHAVVPRIYGRVRAQFSQKELSDLTFAIGIINFWNRLNVPFQTPPGSADALLGLTKAGLT